MNSQPAVSLANALDGACRIRAWANAAAKRWPITIGLLLLCGCTPAEVEPLSSCPQPYLEQTLDRSSTEMLRDTRERAEPICVALPHGCSMSAPKITETGYIVVVAEVGGVSDGKCSYASHSHTSYIYDQHRKFITANGRFVRRKAITP